MSEADATTSADAGLTGLTPLIAKVQGMLVSREAATSAVRQLAEVARDMVGSAVGAGASLFAADGTHVSTATTDRVAELADDLQYQLADGPCISAWATSSVQRLDDTALDERWPRFSAVARELGIRSVVSAPMVFRADTIGALKIYSTAAGAFTAEDERRLVLLTAAAATLLGVARGPEGPQRLSAGLTSAIVNRQTIDVAIGVLVERHQLDQEAARDLLLSSSRSAGLPLFQVARNVLDELTDQAR